MSVFSDEQRRSSFFFFFFPAVKLGCILVIITNAAEHKRERKLSIEAL